jgi:tRNA-dihydrouridine synthase B
MLKIGPVEIKSNLVLSPLAGISDLPYRTINRECGCEFAFVEMINVRSLSHKSKKTKRMLTTTKEDRPLGIQLLGCEEKYLEIAMDVIRKYDFEILDFNAACPERKVARRGEGAALLKEPKKLQKLLKIVVKNSKWPVTLKIRAGWDEKSVNAKDVALLAQDAGISALFIHGRTKEQHYSGTVDYKIIHKVKQALTIPVIASGDILSAELAKKMFDETGCDGLAVARGGLGNPWVFKEIEEYVRTGKLIDRPSKEEVIKVMTRHLDLCVDFYTEKRAVPIFRKFFNWYIKGFYRIKPLREKACHAKSRKDLFEIVEEFSRE